MLKRILTNIWTVSFWLYVLFIIHGTILPYEFTLNPEIVFENLAKFFAFTGGSPIFDRYGDADALANVLFFIPFGFFAFSIQVKNSTENNYIFAIIKIAFFGFLLSTFVETLQIFTSTRFSALSDIITNTVGATLGSLFGYFFLKSHYRQKIDYFIEKLFTDPPGILLLGFSIVLLVAALVPFDFSLSPAMVSRKIRMLTRIEYYRFYDPKPLFSLIFVYGSYGYILMRFFSEKPFGKHDNARTVLAFLTGILVCFILEILQLIISSRYFAWMDVISGTIGIAYGVLAFRFLHNAFSQKWINTKSEKKSISHLVLIFLTTNYIIFVFYKYSYPLSFISDFSIIQDKVNFFLFHALSYAPSTRFLELIIITVKNFALFIPAGIIFGEARFVFKKSEYFIFAMFFLLLFAKAIQLINVQQTPLLFEFLGIALGIFIGNYSWKEYRNLLKFSD